MVLPADWELPSAIRVRVGEKIGRQRAMAADGHLLLLLHKPPTQQTTARQGVIFWRQPDGAWQCNTAPGADGLVLLRRHHEEFALQVEKVEGFFDTTDSAEEYFALLQAVAPLHRATAGLHAAMQQAREAVAHDRDIITLRDRAGEIELAVEQLHADARHALDYATARRAEDQARTSHALMNTGNRVSLIAAIFLPLTAVAAVFGMNLRHGFEDAPPMLFWTVFLLGLASGFMMHSALSSRSHRSDALRGHRHDRPHHRAERDDRPRRE